MGRTPEGWAKRMSLERVPFVTHSWTTVPSIWAATARHIAAVSAKARWQLPIEITRASTSASMCLRSEEHTSELQSLAYLVCRLLLEKKKKNKNRTMRAEQQNSAL